MRVADLPISWPEKVKSSILNVISLAHWAIVYTRAKCANSPKGTCTGSARRKPENGTCPLINRLRGKLERAKNEIGLLKEEIRIKDARMKKIHPKNRPFYSPYERMAIRSLVISHLSLVLNLEIRICLASGLYSNHNHFFSSQ